MPTSQLNLKPYKAISIYFDAEVSSDIFKTAFTQDAVVTDENTEYHGINDILNWMTHSRKQYQYTATPIHLAEDADKTVVKAILEGNFPGSPITLRYEFQIIHGQIAKLEIKE